MKLTVILFLLSAPFQLFSFQQNQDFKKPDSLFISGLSKNYPAQNDSSTRQLPERRSSLGDSFYKVIWVTFVLILFLVFGLYMYKRYVISGSGLINKRIKILSRQNISAKQALLIVNIDGRKFALGSTDHAVNLIADLGEAEEPLESEAKTPNSAFSQVLKKLSNK
ncbi:MAG: flagellar biosynthetic protein FliO [Calditrichaeota bacterium]|nr:flagellar biosynthetic protein FliO [Calditrichota bacterium]